MPPSHPSCPTLHILESLPACPSPLFLCTLPSAYLQLSQGHRHARLDFTPLHPNHAIHTHKHTQPFIVWLFWSFFLLPSRCQSSCFLFDRASLVSFFLFGLGLFSFDAIFASVWVKGLASRG